MLFHGTFHNTLQKEKTYKYAALLFHSFEDVICVSYPLSLKRRCLSLKRKFETGISPEASQPMGERLCKVDHRAKLARPQALHFDNPCSAMGATAALLASHWTPQCVCVCVSNHGKRRRLPIAILIEAIMGGDQGYHGLPNISHP